LFLQFKKIFLQIIDKTALVRNLLNKLIFKEIALLLVPHPVY
jgi:hypothetical protein